MIIAQLVVSGVSVLFYLGVRCGIFVIGIPGLRVFGYFYEGIKGETDCQQLHHSEPNMMPQPFAGQAAWIIEVIKRDWAAAVFGILPLEHLLKPCTFFVYTFQFSVH